MSQYRFLSGTAVSTLVLTTTLLATATHAWAQEALTMAQGEQTGEADITVTGSRIVRDGTKAPSPLTVVGADLLEKRQVTNVAEILNELPAFRGSTTPASTTNLTANVGANFANLRSLGTNRTLVLVDGLRHVPSGSLGQVDLNFIPTLLVERAEVVTGGASAVYGSDAVAGVVNLVLRRKYEGLEGRVDYGITEQGDGREYRGAFVGGTTFGEGRGYATLAVDYYHSDGAHDAYSRKWGRDQYGLVTNATGVLPTRFIETNVNNATMTPNGIITSGPLRGTTFTDSGTPRAFTYGTLAGAQNMVGGEGYGTRLYKDVALMPAIDRQVAYLRTGYEISDAIELFQDFSYGRLKGTASTPYYFNYGNITIQRANPFIPTSVAAQMDTAGITSFSMGRLWTDVGRPVPVSTTKTYRGVSGAKGSLSANWKWNAALEYGRTDYHQQILGSFMAARAAQMLDVVTNPSAGQPICRIALTTPTTACRPFNPFGTNRNDPSVQNYFRANQDLQQRQSEFAASAGVSGKLFDIGAGPWGIALGGEYRRESLHAVADPLSIASVFTFGNARSVDGKFDVKEGYVEIEAPLLANMPVVKSLTLNGGYRYADYSTSGGIGMWKLGATWDVVDDFRLRVTRSRDVRAPNIPELFTPSRALIAVQIIDPFRNNAATLIFPSVQGNPNLQPEVANTLTYGMVFKPSALKGFNFSADYYEVKIGQAISTTASQDIINLCFAAQSGFCSQIQRDPSGQITNIVTQGVNVAKQVVRGIDLEAGYRGGLGGGIFDLRLFANHTIRATVVNGTLTTQLAGQNTGAGIPSWAVTGIASYDLGRMSTTLSARYISDGNLDNSFVVGRDIADNRIPGAVYFSLSGQFKFDEDGNYKLFSTVENLLDKQPANIPSAVFPANPQFYDVLGRRFRIGFSAKLR